jgi:hypothetical protein
VADDQGALGAGRGAGGHLETQLEVADRAQDVADDAGAFGAGRGAGGHVERAGRGKHAVEGRAEALAGTFNAQDVASTLWAACLVALLCVPGQVRRWLHHCSV